MRASECCGAVLGAVAWVDEHAVVRVGVLLQLGEPEGCDAF